MRISAVIIGIIFLVFSVIIVVPDNSYAGNYLG